MTLLKALRGLRVLNRPLPGWLTLALALSSGAMAATPLYYGSFHAAVNGAYITAESSVPKCGYTPTGLYVSDSTGSAPYLALDTSGNLGVCGNENVVGTATAAHLTSSDLGVSLNVCTNASKIITTTGCSTSGLTDPFTVGNTSIGTVFGGTVSGVGAGLLGFKTSGNLEVAFDTLGDIGVNTVEAQNYGSPNFGASLPVCTDSFPHLTTNAAVCNIYVSSFTTGLTPITVEVKDACNVGTVCDCKHIPDSSESACDTDFYYNLSPYTGCHATAAYAGPGSATFGLIAFTGNNTNNGSGNGGVHLLFYNGTGAPIAASTDISAYVQCGGPA